jgi:hypothetical protein
MDSKTVARDKLIGYLMTPPQESAAEVKKAIRLLAKDLDITYEAAWRFLLTGNAA